MKEQASTNAVDPANTVDRATYRLLPDGRLVLRDAELHSLMLERRAKWATAAAFTSQLLHSEKSQ